MVTERYDNLLIRQRLCREALAGPLGYWERAECLETLERIEQEIAELDAPAFTASEDAPGAFGPGYVYNPAVFGDGTQKEETDE